MPRLHRMAVFSILTACVASACEPSSALAQPAARQPSKRDVDRVVQSFLDEHALPGISVAVAAGGEIRYVGAFGVADLEHGVPVGPETVFRIASVTKPITATAVMRLVEDGRLDPDAPVQRYCPSYPSKRWPVTTRQLLAHLGGVPDYNRIEGGVWKVRTHIGWVTGSSPFHYPTLDEAVAIFAGDSLAFRPGTEHRYSNTGYVLLGCAIEGASGMRYEDFLAEAILGPAGMTRTRGDDAWAVIRDRARPYQMRIAENADWWWWTPVQKRALRVGDLHNARFEDTSLKRSAGGLLSTATDLVRFAIAFHGGDLVEPGTRDSMLVEQTTRAGEATGWGLGWSLSDRDGERVVGLSGGQPGASAVLAILPESAFAVAILVNRDLVSLRPLVTRLGRLWGRFPGSP